MTNRTDIHVGPAKEVLARLPAGSVHCIVTSPPYWGLRSYKGDPGMIGLEPTFDAHLENLLAVFRECWRVLRNDGIMFVNYGDSYAGGGRGKGADLTGTKQHTNAGSVQGNIGGWKAGGWKQKDLMMMPARLAIAMQDDGWFLRSEIIWHKPNPIPEPCTDRPTSAHEKVFLLSKRARYFYDHVAVRTEGSPNTHPRRKDGQWKPAKGSDPLDRRAGSLHMKPDKQRGHDRRHDRRHDGLTDKWDAMSKAEQQAGGANMRNFLSIATHGYKGAHFATYPPALITPFIKAGTSEKGCCAECGAPWARIVEKSGDSIGRSWHDHADDLDRGQRAEAPESKGGHGYTVESKGWQPTCDCGAGTVPAVILDPFAGSGTTALVANRLQRDAVLIEISPEYAEMARKRIEDDGGWFARVEIRETDHR